jgi:hypothetical protein
MIGQHTYPYATHRKLLLGYRLEPHPVYDLVICCKLDRLY